MTAECDGSSGARTCSGKPSKYPKTHRFWCRILNEKKEKKMYMNSGQLVEFFFLNQKINKGVKNNINTKSINKFGLIEII